MARPDPAPEHSGDFVIHNDGALDDAGDEFVRVLRTVSHPVQAVGDTRLNTPRRPLE
ncbi:hypothetical protein VX037_10770 [Gordonia sp. Z-3]|uniref:Uncharacterized protein n=2 Tax=Gordonia TaxID=2053 RepID=A0A9X3I342_9ACTN|nr:MULTISPECIES: hypothetical protein [Gordonia]MCF3938900.1 hypothetical protein [Gordonia tangerina]MCX2962595.1 hypothetical protein [Gordonia aquimaris]MED5801508.1 hypothetical protein [Gordonia sp. Z-3]